MQPDPVIRIFATFGGNADTDVGYGVLRLQEGAEDPTVVEQHNWGGATTDDTGLAEVEFDAVRGRWYGVTLFLDNDDSNDLSDGDTVWGAGNGEYSYVHYAETRPIGDSVGILVEDWATYSGGETNTF
ncbi:MAG: hypothetical protein ACOCXN_06625 [Spirochaetota bacterium]